MPNRLKKKLPPLGVNVKDIGKRISKIRKEKGYTQNELANKIGILHTLVSDYERGKCRIFDEMVVRFAIALEVTADEILGLKEHKYKEIKPTLKIMRRLKRIEQLPPKIQNRVLENLDFVLDSASKK